MAVIDYSRLFQVVPELDCAITNTLTLQQFTLRSLWHPVQTLTCSGESVTFPLPSLAQSAVNPMSPIVEVHQH